MSSLIRRLKFAWDYFVRGRHRSSSKRTPRSVRSPAQLDWHEDPLVGRYVRTKMDTWWTDTPLKNLGYDVRLIAPGPAPTAAQMESFEALACHLPALITAANLEPIPKDDGWGHAPPPFDIHTAHISSILLRADGGYFLMFDVEPEDVYMLAPSFVISPDLRLISAEWSV